jgi:hypothetical protein
MKSERTKELLQDRALEGLTPAERRELEALGGSGDESFELSAAAIHVARAGRLEPLPAAVESKLRADGEAFLRDRQRAAAGRAERAEVASAEGRSTTAAGAQVIVMPLGEPARARVDAARWSGWLAAAACMVVVALQALASHGQVSRGAANEAEAETESRVAAVDLVRAPVQPAADASGARATGEATWSQAEQRGELRVRGLARSAPGTQYQVWVVDAARDARYPVALARFSADGDGESTVALRAQVSVAQPTKLLVTVERAGGAVVPDGSRLTLTAALSGAR